MKTQPPISTPTFSPMRGAYYAQNPALVTYLRTISAIARMVTKFRARRMTPEPDRVERLLVFSGGHIGDAVMLTALLPAIRSHYPQARLGVLCGSWSRAVFDGHSLVDDVFVLDHWKLDRAPGGRAAKLWRYAAATAQLAHRLRQARFDLAIDLCPYYPNAALPLWLSRIGFTVGFRSGGASALYDLAVPLQYRNIEIAELQFALLAALGVPRQPVETLAPILAVPDTAWTAVLATYPALGERYTVIHPGAGSAVKQWPAGQWRMLLDAFDLDHRRVVITGRGARERAFADALSIGHTKILSLVDKLDWPQFAAVIAHSAAVICVDSAAAHVAAAAGRPTIVIAPGITDRLTWRPLNLRSLTLTSSVPCSPCFLANGCEAMACVRGVRAEDVSLALERVA